MSQFPLESPRILDFSHLYGVFFVMNLMSPTVALFSEAAINGVVMFSRCVQYFISYI